MNKNNKIKKLVSESICTKEKTKKRKKEKYTVIIKHCQEVF